jgi:hypothetical protein
MNKNNKKDEKTYKFKWESDDEFRFRMTVYDISARVSRLISTLATYEKQSKPDYTPCLLKIRTEKGRLNGLNIPDTYKTPIDFLKQGYDYYENAFNSLIEAFKAKIVVNQSNDSKLAGQVARAASYIETGNAFVKIVNTKLFEIFENKQAEYIKKNEEVKQ